MQWMDLAISQTAIVIIILRMMSELNKQAHKTDPTSTQTFILKKQRPPHPPDTPAHPPHTSQPYPQL